MFQTDLLKDKIIIVTGGGTGLGKSMSTRFSELGAKVVICSRKMEILEKSAEEITQQTGNEVFPYQLDVRKAEDIEKLINVLDEKYGKIDVLLNNAAGNFISPTERLSYKAFDTVVDIVLRGTYYFSLAMGKYWISKKVPGNILKGRSQLWAMILAVLSPLLFLLQEILIAARILQGSMAIRCWEAPLVDFSIWQWGQNQQEVFQVFCIFLAIPPSTFRISC